MGPSKDPFGRTLSAMVDQTYLVALKLPESSIRRVSAASFAFHGDHLAFLDAKGRLAALFHAASENFISAEMGMIACLLAGGLGWVDLLWWP